MKHARAFGCLLALSLQTGCSGSSDASQADGPVPTREPTALYAHGSPGWVVQTIYEGLVFTAQRRSDMDTLIACLPDYATERNLALASVAILFVRESGDSAIVAVQATSIADERMSTEAPDRMTAVLGVRIDTLHQKVIRDSPGGPWKLCGYPDEQVGFVKRGSDDQTDWLPSGASWRDVPRLVDSVRAARSTSH